MDASGYRPHTSLALLMSEFNAAQRRMAAMLSERADDPTGSAETLLLAALCDYEMSPSVLADRLGLTRGRMTHLVDRLVERGLVSRRTLSSDRRQKRIALTADGRPVGERARRRVAEAAAVLEQDLGAAGVDMLAQHLRSIGRSWTLFADPEADSVPGV